MADAAAALVGELGGSEERARSALVASTPEELAKGLELLRDWLDEASVSVFDTRAGEFLGIRDDGADPRIGFLFPGQGSPARADGGLWSRRFPEVRETYESAATSDNPSEGMTARAQPAIVAAALAGLAVLDRAGISADVAIGHSLGELSAMHWGGAVDAASAVAIAKARGRAMSDPATVPAAGAMASLGVDAGRAAGLLGGTPVVIAGYNSPRQTVVSGPAQAVGEVVARCRALGLAAVELPVGHAFHSPLVAGAVPALADALDLAEFSPLRRAVVSTITGDRLPRDADLRELLRRQVTSPVRFREALSGCEGVDLWIEVGPGAILSGLAEDCGAARPCRSISVARRSAGFSPPRGRPSRSGPRSARGRCSTTASRGPSTWIVARGSSRILANRPRCPRGTGRHVMRIERTNRAPIPWRERQRLIATTRRSTSS